MPLPVIDDTYRCAFKWSSGSGGSGRSAVNVMHILAAATTTDDVMNAIFDNVAHTMWSGVSDQFAVNDVTVQALDGTTAAITRVTARDAQWTGTGGTQYSPASAAVVKLITGFAGRSKRGRLFLPYIAEDSMADGALGSDVVGQGQTAWEAFRSAMEGDGFELAVASYKLESSLPVLQVSYEAPLGTQRRRQERVRAGA